MRKTFIQNREHFYHSSFNTKEGYNFLKEFFKDEKRDVGLLTALVSQNQTLLNLLLIFIEKRLNVNILHKDNIIIKVY